MWYQYRVPWTVNITLSYGETIHEPIEKRIKAVSGHQEVLDSKISLLTPEDIKDQEVWDEEFRRRQLDLERQQLQSRDRRRRTSAKMDELKRRWEGVERRRDLRSRQSNRQSLASRETTMIEAAPVSEVTTTGSRSNPEEGAVDEVS